MLERIRDYQLRALKTLDWEKEENNFVLLRGAWHVNAENDFELDREVQNFLLSQKKVLLLLSHSGGGKSFYTKKLALSCLDKCVKGSSAPVPLWISLPSLKDPINEAIHETFQTMGFAEDEVEALRQTQSFLFILDGYDEIHDLRNLYVGNQLSYWQAKMVITCRQEYLYSVESYASFFMPFKNERPLRAAYSELIIRPFNATQIEIYGKQFIQNHGIQENWESHAKAIEEIPGLKQLITKPFMLKLAMEALPSLMVCYQDVTRQQLTQARLYDVFVEQWFTRQEEKLKLGRHIGPNDDIKAEFWSYAKSLAKAIYASGKSEVFYSGEESRLFRAEGKEVNSWEKFFNPKEPRLKLLRTACLVQEVSLHHYAFMHPSLIEYFLTRDLFDRALISEKKDIPEEVEKPIKIIPQITETSSISSNLNQHFLVKDQNIIQFLADRVWEEPAYKDFLFAQVYASKNNSEMSTAASNAITILNHARVSFSGLDLSNIRIPNAYLGNAILDSTQLQSANLKNVNLQSAWLRKTNFTKAKMLGICFGEKPAITLEHAISDCCYSEKHQLFAVTNGKNIEVYSVNSFEFLRRLQGHTEEVTNIVFHPCGEQIASSSKDYTVRLWDVNTGKELAKFTYFEGYSVQLMYVQEPKDNAIEPGKLYVFLVGNSIICKAKNKQNHIERIELTHDLYSRDKVTITEILSDPTRKKQLDDSTIISIFHVVSQRGYEWSRLFCTHYKTLAYNASGKVLAYAWGKQTIILWNTETHHELGRFESDLKGSDIACMVFDRLGENLAVGTAHGSVSIFDFAMLDKEPKTFARSKGVMIDKACSTCFSQDSKIIAIGKTKGNIELWDIETAQMIREIKAHTDVVTRVLFLPKETILVSGSDDGTVCLWDITTGQELQTYSLHLSNVTCLALCEEMLISGSWDKQLRFVNIDSQNRIASIQKDVASISSVIFDSANQTLISGNYDGAICLWDVVTGEMKQKFEIGSSALFGTKVGANCIALSEDSRFLAVGVGNECRLIIWDMKTKKELCRFKHTVGEVVGVAFTTDPYLLASVSSDGTVSLWDLLRQNEKERLVYGGNLVTSNCMTYKHGILSWDGGFSNKVHLWDVEKRREFSFERHSSMVSCLAFDAEGKRIASGSKDKTVRIWCVTTKKELLTLKHTSEVLTIAFSPNGNMLASGTDNGVLFIWDLASGECLKAVSAFNGKARIRSVSWGKNDKGEFLATGVQDGSIRVWRITELLGLIEVILHWTSQIGRLVLNDAIINGVKGLSLGDAKLMNQRGAQGEPLEHKEMLNVSSSKKISSSESSGAIGMPQKTVFFQPAPENGPKKMIKELTKKSETTSKQENKDDEKVSDASKMTSPKNQQDTQKKSESKEDNNKKQNDQQKSSRSNSSGCYIF